jgi:hypothetical protein
MCYIAATGFNSIVGHGKIVGIGGTNTADTRIIQGSVLIEGIYRIEPSCAFG